MVHVTTILAFSLRPVNQLDMPAVIAVCPRRNHVRRRSLDSGAAANLRR
jgi:hypothetical protein